MRIIAGQYRSRTLRTPAGRGTRPTADRLREALFNVLAPRMEGAYFADLYAGSGAVGLEAISRGASFVWFAERDPKAVAAIRANLGALAIAGGYALEDRGVQRLLAAILKQPRAADIVFLDPPYEASEEYAATLSFLGEHADVLLASGAVVVAEHARRHGPAPQYGALIRTRLLEQGDAGLSFYAARALPR